MMTDKHDAIQQEDVQKSESHHVEHTTHGLVAEVSPYVPFIVLLKQTDAFHSEKADPAFRQFGDERIEVTEEDNKRILRRTDLFILPVRVLRVFPRRN